MAAQYGSYIVRLLFVIALPTSASLNNTRVVTFNSLSGRDSELTVLQQCCCCYVFGIFRLAAALSPIRSTCTENGNLPIRS
jgi:hypothetical protein